MTRLERLEIGAYRAALLLTLVAAARFGWSLVQTTSQRVAATEPPSNPVHGGPGGIAFPVPFPGSPSAGAPLGMPSPEAIQSAIAAAVGSSGTVPSAIGASSTSTPRDIVHSYLSVQAGAPRSELRINGELVGKTPFVGQISCERGQTVKVDLLPPKGLPSHYAIPCLEGEMRLRDEP
jgi:hypothetical protein